MTMGSNINDLLMCEYQYLIRHNDVNQFTCGEIVFLKSNPEYPMVVCTINDSTITTRWYSKTNEVQKCDFPPECILQYEYSGLLVYKNIFNISLN